MTSQPTTPHNNPSHSIPSHCITRLHITYDITCSRHLTWHHITPHHTTWHDTTSYHITSCDLTWHHITSHHIMRPDMKPHHTTWQHMIWYDISQPTTLPHVTSHPIASALLHLISQPTTWHHNTSYHFTSQHITPQLSHHHRWRTTKAQPAATKHHHQTEQLKAGAHKQSINKLFLWLNFFFPLETSAPGPPGNYWYSCCHHFLRCCKCWVVCRKAVFEVGVT